MAWQRKEKPLTRDQAITEARIVLAPYWFASDPLIAATPADPELGRPAAVYPLTAAFEKKAWAVILADPTQFSWHGVLTYAREWHKRYSPHRFEVMLVLRSPFPTLNAMGLLHAAIGKSASHLMPAQLVFPIVLDHDGMLFEVFGASRGLPRVEVVWEKNRICEFSSPDIWSHAEIEIQKFLRIRDPGLPLSLPMKGPEGIKKELGFLELKKGVLPSGVKLTGNWILHDDHIESKDSTAGIDFVTPSPYVGIVAKPVNAGKPIAHLPSLRIELSTGPVYDSVSGIDLSFSDDGKSELKVVEPRLYHLLKALPVKERHVIIQCHQVEKDPIAIYGFRLAE